MKKLTLLLIFLSSLFAADSLMDALLDGNLTHKINANSNEASDEESPFSSTKTQKILFHYKTAPVEGVRLEVATQSFATETRQSSTDNTIYYTEALYDGRADDIGYKLRANYYADTYRQSVEQSSIETTNAFGVKAQVNYENFGSYVAYSKVLEGSHSANGDLDGKDHLLPTSSVLSSNNYTPNTEAYAVDLNYSPRKDITLGSRYVVASEVQTNLSYTGVYSNFQLNEISKGFNLGVAFDKTGQDKQNDQFSINFKSKF
ncbi:hypothetical protein [Sulfurospirillum halorespirans]|uniref:Uncharacterized protein n=1 Tax=Sulfurospirillum halorespirans DSM 13726 TaxID=1193502 RepID=A0A1D7TIT3_9BACT|nr:hypothetical protein [Sulfurospirillum halorespirans]AOO64784.1 hypothetical protein SHALO_1003 [Sulfurospirillum halorespirans DSM 13726]